MVNKDIVSSIMANLREFHPELPERARVKLEFDLRRMGRRQLRQKRNPTVIGNSNTSKTDSANEPIAQ